MGSRSRRTRNGHRWATFTLSSGAIASDATCRLDYKYWDPQVRKRSQSVARRGGKTIENLNRIDTGRGKSPPADLYVDATDGFARVLKAGSSLTSYGEIAQVSPQSDFIEKAEFEKAPESSKVERGDVLLASTGTGTLGKAAVYESTEPAIADGHVTIIRVDPAAVAPRYLADYLRVGFGREQIERLYTGSTGLIELTPSQVDAIVVELPSLPDQRSASARLRRSERACQKASRLAADKLSAARSVFADEHG